MKLADSFRFTFDELRHYFQQALDNGYKVIRCVDYTDYKRIGRTDKIVVNRVDIDLSCKKAKIIAEIFNDLNIKATFFVRLHASEYNPFSFENYRCLKFIRDSGHEIGYHSEIIDEVAIWQEDAVQCFKRDIQIINAMLDVEIKGVASHRGMTSLNNLDFWLDRRPEEFGLLYETYDKHLGFDLFRNSFYISDSEWTQWKCYNNGILVEGDRRTLGEHFSDNHQVIYSLIHPDSYYNEHFYE